MSKRYLILSIGYNHVAVPYSNGADLAALMGALADAKQVASTGYGDDQRWTPSSNEPVQIQLIDGSRVTIGDDLATLKAQMADIKTNAEQYSKWWSNSNAENARLKKELEALKAKPAESHAPVATTDDDIPL